MSKFISSDVSDHCTDNLKQNTVGQGQKEEIILTLYLPFPMFVIQLQEVI